LAKSRSLQDSNTPTLRAAGFEHEDEHEHEYEGAGEANRTPKPCIGQLLNQAN
jgi:hypothetical protein